MSSLSRGKQGGGSQPPHYPPAYRPIILASSDILVSDITTKMGRKYRERNILRDLTNPWGEEAPGGKHLGQGRRGTLTRAERLLRRNILLHSNILLGENFNCSETFASKKRLLALEVVAGENVKEVARVT